MNIKKINILPWLLCAFIQGYGQDIPDSTQNANITNSSEPHTAPSPITPTRALLWADEFNDTEINTNKWEIMHIKRRTDPTGRDAWWHKDNAYLSGTGHLVIRTSQLADGSYAGACIRSKGKYEPRYGYFEVRAKLQKEEGHWGAFWLFTKGVNTVGNQGEDGTEIDVFESPYIGLGRDSMQSALHYDGYEEAHRNKGKTVIGMNFNDGNWHTFGVEWTPEGYRFFYDDVMVWETDFGGVSKVPQYLKISDEIGTWGGILDIRKANLPDYMLVDYVRVYDRR